MQVELNNMYANIGVNNSSEKTIHRFMLMGNWRVRGCRL
jgi:hypothetical protein